MVEFAAGAVGRLFITVGSPDPPVIRAVVLEIGIERHAPQTNARGLVIVDPRKPRDERGLRGDLYPETHAVSVHIGGDRPGEVGVRVHLDVRKRI